MLRGEFSCLLCFNGYEEEEKKKTKTKTKTEKKKKKTKKKKKKRRESHQKEDPGARKGRKVAKHCVFPMFCG
jgi:flagellar biosynthesis component FlhA